MKIRIPTLAFTLLFFILLSGCSDEVRINSVAFSETLTLKSENKHQHTIWLAFNGRVEGVARISLMLEGKPYKTEELNGDINFEWRTDWYSSEAILEYEHGTAKGGSLTINYGF